MRQKWCVRICRQKELQALKASVMTEVPKPFIAEWGLKD